MSTLSDSEQWKEIQNGNKILFESNFRSYYQMLFNFAFSKLKDSDTAEEIVQSVFVKLWEKRKDLEISSLKSYLFSSVNNTVLNHFKHEQVKREHHNEMKVVEPDGVDDTTVEYNELQNQVFSLIDSMPEQRQRIFKMAKMEGLKYKQIAESLNISVKTVENHMGKALSYLREHLSDFFILLPLLLNY